MSRPERAHRYIRSTFQRSLHEERRAVAGWSVGLAAAVGLEIALFPTIRANDMAKVLDSYPEALRRLFSLNDFSTGTGFVNAELFSLVVPLMLVIFAILWGSDGIAGEEERRTLDLLLAAPISRRRVLLEKAAATAVGVASVGSVVLLVLLVGDAAADLGIGAVHLIAAVGSTVGLAILFGWIALGMGAATGHRGLARGASAVLAVAAYLLSSLATLVPGLRPWRTASPWYHALGVDPLAKGTTVGHVTVLLGLGACALVAGSAAFTRRDVAT
ncbi:hypothetical protein BH10ACT1_BH10ACT1_22830 [soil metagenome]